MAWARVASQGTTATSAANPSSLGITMPGATTVNNRMILVISYNGNNAVLPSVLTVLDGTNTWLSDRAATGASDGGYLCRTEVWSANVSSSTTPTVTVTLTAALTGGDGIALTIQEYSGLDTSATPVDVATSSAATNGVATSGNTAATNAANELVIGAYGDDGTNTAITGSGGLSNVRSVVSGIAGNVLAEKDSGATGVQSATFTNIPGTTSDVIHCVVYKLGTAGAATLSRPTGILTVQQAMNRLANFFRRLQVA